MNIRAYRWRLKVGQNDSRLNRRFTLRHDPNLQSSAIRMGENAKLFQETALLVVQVVPADLEETYLKFAL